MEWSLTATHRFPLAICRLQCDGFVICRVTASLGRLGPVSGLLYVPLAACCVFGQLGSGCPLPVYPRNDVLPLASVLPAWPWQWVTSSGAHSVAIVQGNVDQAVKWDADQRQAIVNRYLRLSELYWSADLALAMNSLDSLRR